MNDFGPDVTFLEKTLRRPWYRVSTRKAIVLVFGVGCFLGFVLMIQRAVWEAREAARRSQCVCNFCQITLALLNYQDSYGALPPAHVDDARGHPMHSWRVLILPFMEQQALYAGYDMSEPWDSANNRKLLRQMPAIYACPSRFGGSRTGTSLTSYVALTGPGTAFPDGKAVNTADIKDGASRTLIAAEVANVDIPWTQPVDLDVRTMSFRVNDPKRPAVSSPHRGGANVSFADGAKNFLSESISPEDLRALITIDGGENLVPERPSRHDSPIEVRKP